MISVAAIRMQQFGVHFYQASLTASDIDKLVRFEVLNYGERGQPVRGGRKKAPAPSTKVNWDLLERRIAASDKAYQRQIIRKKIDELVQVPTSSAGRRAICRRLPAPSSSRAMRRCASSRPRPDRCSARSRCRSARASCARSTASTGCWRCMPTSSASATRRSRFRRSSSTACRKITSCRCSSPSTPSTRG